MLLSIFIILSSTAMLVYWIRCSCLLLLRECAPAAAVSAAVERQFRFGSIRRQLVAGAAIAGLCCALDHDSRVLTYLLQHGSRLHITQWEDRLLVWDYHLLRWLFKLAQLAGLDQARSTLAEAAQVMEVLAIRTITRVALKTQL